MNKLLVVLIVLLGLAAAYAVFSINQDPLTDTSNALAESQRLFPDKQSIEKQVVDNENIDEKTQNFRQQQGNAFDKKDNVVKTSADIADLPADITLSGIVYSKDLAQSYTALLVDQIAGEYVIDENINDLDVFVKRINKASVVLEFESRDYELVLGESNSLVEEQTQLSFNEMSAKEIGSRPRQLEHIVKTLPNLFNDGGKVIIPGKNPDLYSKIRFQEGDVLLEVNGYEIDDDKQLSDLQKEIRSAQTLSFKVNRAGRLITLYLDIPHEALKL